jgi:hypothetical protein
MNKGFFIETTNIIEPEPYMNGHCMIPLAFLCVSKSKMIASTGQEFSIEPYCKDFNI